MTPAMTDMTLLGNGLEGQAIARRILSQPGVQKVPSPKLDLFLVREFLDADTCAALIEQIDAVRRPSTIADPNGDAAFRTSETGDLFAGDPLVQAVEARFTAFTGLHPAHGEPLQGQRYAVCRRFPLLGPRGGTGR